MKPWWIVVALGVLAAVAVWRASRLRSQKTTSAAVDVSASSSTTSASGSTSTTVASASSSTTPTSAKGTFEPLYERTVRDRVVRVTRGHVAASSFPMLSALARSRTDEWVSAVLRIPIDELDDVADLESPELLSGTAFDGSCGVSLFMYIDAGKSARSCAEALDPSRDLDGQRETLDLVKLGVDPSLFADVIDFEGQGIPMRLVRVVGVVDDLCFAMQATMKAESDRRFGLLPLLVKGLSVATKRSSDL